MKILKYMAVAAALSAGFFSCSDDDDKKPGNPVISGSTYPQSAFFGDSIAFSAEVDDNEVPLSTLKACLYYGDEMVNEAVIRTKTGGKYEGKLFAPYYANIPDGNARLKFVLQNINLTIKEQTVDLPLSRPDFSYLTLQVSEVGNYRMERISKYNYAVTADLPQKIKAVIVAPAVDSNGTEITFGWEDAQIRENVTAGIPFSNDQAGEYTVTFNTLTYDAGPFISLTFAGEEMEMTADDVYQVDLNLDQEQVIEVTGISDLEDWWIDPDFFTMNDGSLTFLPISGKYRVIADFNYNYFKVETMDGNETAKLQDNGEGAVWVIGQGVGKPSLSNEVGWDTGKGICMPVWEQGIYRITLVAGETINSESVNFKFFHEKGWTGQFDPSNMTNSSNLLFVNDDPDNDFGNVFLADGKTLTPGKTYLITIDVRNGVNSAVLTVVEK